MAANRAKTRRLMCCTSGDADHISEEVEVCKRCQAHTGQIALRHGTVGLVPKADIRQIQSDDTLNLLKQVEAPGIVCGRTRLVEKSIDLRVAIVPAVPTRR